MAENVSRRSTSGGMRVGVSGAPDACGPTTADPRPDSRSPHGICDQEAPQAHVEEEAPQAASQDPSPASQQEVTPAPSGR
ncbi:hypothetical protein MICRO116_570034 [Micrococcus sp. 116]|nr:hypothetical protein MICRO116_570034 [Micrococcus sp. 116]